MGAKRVLSVAAGDPRTLDELLHRRLGIALPRLREWIARGAVQVNARRIESPTFSLSAGDRVVVREPDTAAPLDEEPVIAHRDEDLLIIDKPAGQLSQPSPGEAASAERQVQARFPSARLVHRLDRDASGLLLFALRPTAHAALQQALDRRAIEREYLAVASGHVDGPSEIRLRIARDPADARKRIALPERASGGNPAATRVIPRPPNALEPAACALRLVLGTGRTHQIRVHLAAVGHPLLGDRLYGGPPASRLMLHAFRLRLPRPSGDGTIECIAPAPPEFDEVWTKYGG